MKKFIKVLAAILLLLIIVIAGIAGYIKLALPNLGAAPSIKVTVTSDRVARGEYIANHVAVCMDCHSQRDWTLYAGPIKEGTFGGGGEKFGKELGFPGTLYSKNITPHALQNWTDGELFRAITEGVTKDGKALFPLMGYPGYGKMDSEDVYSVIAYLRTLPVLKNEVPERSLDFPVSLLVNTMPANATLSVKPDTTDIVAYGQYVITIANCMDCHSKVDKGKLVAGTEYGGGRAFPFPNKTVDYSANITPDKGTGIGSWSKELFIQKFKQYADSTYKPRQVAANDYNSIMPWAMYSGMSKQDLGAIYAYLQTVKPISNKVTSFVKE